LRRNFLNKLLILPEALLGAEFLMARAGEVCQRVGAAPDFILLGGMESPFGIRQMIEDEHFRSQRQGVSQSPRRIIHFVQTKLEVDDIPTWRGLTEVRLSNIYSIL